jgi:hypothetical protein
MENNDTMEMIGHHNKFIQLDIGGSGELRAEHHSIQDRAACIASDTGR